MIKSSNKKIYSIALAVFLVIGSLIWLTFLFQIQRIKDSADSIQEEKLDFSVRQRKGEQITRLKKELSDIQSRQKEIEATLVNKNNAVPVLRSLEDIAGESNSEIKISVADLTKLKADQAKNQEKEDEEEAVKKDEKTAKFGEKSGEGKTDPLAELRNQLGLSLEITATFPSFEDFLYKMENLPYFIQVYTMEILPTADKNKDQPAGSAVKSPDQSGGTNNDSKERLIKATMLIIVYTNDQK